MLCSMFYAVQPAINCTFVNLLMFSLVKFVLISLISHFHILKTASFHWQVMPSIWAQILYKSLCRLTCCFENSHIKLLIGRTLLSLSKADGNHHVYRFLNWDRMYRNHCLPLCYTLMHKDTDAGEFKLTVCILHASIDVPLCVCG